MDERKVQRVTIRVEFADDSVQEFSAEEPAEATLTVKRSFPWDLAPTDPGGHLDLSRIPVSGGHTFTLQLTLGGGPPSPSMLMTGPCGYSATGYGRESREVGQQ